jgi:hypothetical protein
MSHVCRKVKFDTAVDHVRSAVGLFVIVRVRACTGRLRIRNMETARNCELTACNQVVDICTIGSGECIIYDRLSFLMEVAYLSRLTSCFNRRSDST